MLPLGGHSEEAVWITDTCMRTPSQASSQNAMYVQVEEWPPHPRHCHPSRREYPSQQHLDDC